MLLMQDSRVLLQIADHPVRRKSKPKNTEASRRNCSDESVRSSPVHGSCYSAMDSEDRKEHLKEVISYCKNSWDQGDQNVSLQKLSPRSH
ncbi:hypothetical protein Patl1_13407 [Pistacia atlantica]|uniref:Uncharacterized protein n=1 Tax=Pistacia atlantica TaxID=434234 RepID=A0ACC1ASU7_9ROSI|nr:hypothetical protein Patl1_13407 [Pistacia atlantica]